MCVFHVVFVEELEVGVGVVVEVSGEVFFFEGEALSQQKIFFWVGVNVWFVEELFGGVFESVLDDARFGADDVGVHFVFLLDQRRVLFVEKKGLEVLVQSV